MLSYQHGYHAGNFADVVKHFTLVRIMRYLCQKEAPFFYLETHAGKGLYDIKAQEAIKTNEASQGIELLWARRAECSELFLPYFESIQSCNLNHPLRYYPGSPAFAVQQLRLQDRLYCCELHPAEFKALHQYQRQHRAIKFHVSHTDGLQQLSVLLPPLERRGLIFIDPSYEIKTDYQTIPKYIEAAVHRFSHGIYCLWYPILNQNWHLDMLTRLSKMPGHSLRVEWMLNDPKAIGMKGCGLWIMNPPYVLAGELNAALPLLTTILNRGMASFEIMG